MSVQVKVVQDEVRGCGWRKEGGLYLVSGGVMAPCGRLPVPLTRCPCCDAGIKPTRGWTWVNARQLMEGTTASREAVRTVNACRMSPAACVGCPMAEPPERAGLLWVGEKFYATPTEFLAEAARLGVSRRVSQLPRDFKVNETWVLFAHRLALDKPEDQPRAAVFHAFKPTAVQYITRGNETEEELEALVKRGITPVKVEKKGPLNL